jgi:hypothetical protein
MNNVWFETPRKPMFERERVMSVVAKAPNPRGFCDFGIIVSWRLDSLWQTVEVSSFRLRVVRGCWLLTGFASRLPVGTGQDLTASISDLSVSASWFWLGDFSIVTILWLMNLEMRRRGEEKKIIRREHAC